MTQSTRHRQQRRFFLFSPSLAVLPAAIAAIAAGLAFLAARPAAAEDKPATRPNILFCIADDWGWPHAGAYGDPVVKTPNFDRIARQGVLFNHAYVTSPSCTPSRNAILTGQWHWRLDGGANLWSIFPDRFATYPEMLDKAGYFVGTTGKSWGPGRLQTPGRPISGKPFKNFDSFLAERPAGKPFCFWLGTSDPHRPYDEGTGKASGMALDKIRLPACFPDSEIVRGDVADYYFEVQRFDSLVGSALAALEKIGELDNTIVLMTGDHGMPFPRCKANLYDSGSRVALAIRWPAGMAGGRTSDDFVSLADLAPTYLELAGVPRPDDMTGRSLVNVLRSPKSGQIDPARRHVIFGKERHVPCQEKPDMGGYPCRGIRTHEFLYIRNFTPERWPNGTPDYKNASIPGAWLADCDNGPTKSYMVENREKDETHRRLYDLSFAKRPAEELYDLKKDPDQLVNVAEDPFYAKVKKELADRLTAELTATADPRVIGGGERLEAHPYFGSGPRFPGFKEGE